MITLLLSLALFLSHPYGFTNTQTEPVASKVYPSDVPGLPYRVARELERKHCLVPVVTYYDKKYLNVIRGEFVVSGQHDWAGLCSREGQSNIVVIWGGRHRCPAELENLPDSIYGEEKGTDDFHFDRALAVAGPKLVRRLLKQNKESVGFDIQHDAISDAYLGKGSVVHYCHAGKWKKLQGSD